MEFKDLLDRKENDGTICVVDTCIAAGTGVDFETKGEFCSECECGFLLEQVTIDNLVEINNTRVKFSQPKIKM